MSLLLFPKPFLINNQITKPDKPQIRAFKYYESLILNGNKFVKVLSRFKFTSKCLFTYFSNMTQEQIFQIIKLHNMNKNPLKTCQYFKSIDYKTPISLRKIFQKTFQLRVIKKLKIDHKNSRDFYDQPLQQELYSLKKVASNQISLYFIGEDDLKDNFYPFSRFNKFKEINLFFLKTSQLTIISKLTTLKQLEKITIEMIKISDYVEEYNFFSTQYKQFLNSSFPKLREFKIDTLFQLLTKFDHSQFIKHHHKSLTTLFVGQRGGLIAFSILNLFFINSSVLNLCIKMDYQTSLNQNSTQFSEFFLKAKPLEQLESFATEGMACLGNAVADWLCKSKALKSLKLQQRQNSLKLHDWKAILKILKHFKSTLRAFSFIEKNILTMKARYSQYQEGALDFLQDDYWSEENILEEFEFKITFMQLSKEKLKALTTFLPHMPKLRVLKIWANHTSDMGEESIGDYIKEILQLKQVKELELILNGTNFGVSLLDWGNQFMISKQFAKFEQMRIQLGTCKVEKWMLDEMNSNILVFFSKYKNYSITFKESREQSSSDDSKCNIF